jgi:Putative transposase
MWAVFGGLHSRAVRCVWSRSSHRLFVQITNRVPELHRKAHGQHGIPVVDRVLPDMPVRQYVLTLPYELRKLVAFKADVLTAIGRMAVEAIYATYRARAKRHGVQDGECGAINLVQRFVSLNLHVHFHIMVIDGVFIRDGEAGVLFHPALPPAREELDSIARRVRDRSLAWLRRHGYLDERPLEERSNDPPAQTALDACAAIAMGRGQVATLPNADAPEDDHEQGAPGKPSLAVERDGFNLHAGVRIEAGDDLGRERLIRYGARPPLSLERLRRLPGGRVAYRLKYVTRGRGKFRVMTGIEFMARLAAIIAPPRYPLVRYAGVLGPRSAWRKDIVPKPRERRPACGSAGVDPPAYDTPRPRAEPKKSETSPPRSERSRDTAGPAHPAGGPPR